MSRLIYCVLILLCVVPCYGFDTGKTPLQMTWPFDGIFGKVDRQAAQRGFLVYKDVCAACHSMKLLYYRNLEDLGFSKEEVKAIAAGYTVTDGPDKDGNMFERPALPSDHFVSPFPNEEAARAANGGGYPVDLSVIIKARQDGANYVYSLLTNYGDTAPADHVVPEGAYYNPYFPNGVILMPPPLPSEGMVQYSDGVHASIDQMSRDVVVFLQWAAEPEMEDRKQMGIKVIVFLVVFTIFFYLAKKRIWSRLE